MKRFPIMFFSLFILVMYLYISSGNPSSSMAAPDRTIPWWLGETLTNIYHESACTNGMELWFSDSLANKGDKYTVTATLLSTGETLFQNNLTFNYKDDAGRDYGVNTIKWSRALQPGTIVEITFISPANESDYKLITYVHKCRLPEPIIQNQFIEPNQFQRVYTMPPTDYYWFDKLNQPIPSGGCVTSTRNVAQQFILSDVDVSLYVSSNPPAVISASLIAPDGTEIQLLDSVHLPSEYYGRYWLNIPGGRPGQYYPPHANSLIIDEDSDFLLSSLSPPYERGVVKSSGPRKLSELNGRSIEGNWSLKVCHVNSLALASQISISDGSHNSDSGSVLNQWAVIFEKDESPPQISNLTVDILSETSARVRWETDEPADSKVRYGKTSGSYPYEKSFTNLVTNHEVTLTGLTPGSKYYFIVLSSDTVGNIGQSQEDSFSTNTNAPQYILDVLIIGFGAVEISPNNSLYDSGQLVTLTADPSEGHVFSNWSGDLSGTSNPIQITMDGNKTVTASFVPDQPTTYTLVTLPSAGGSIIRDPDKVTYQSSEVVTLAADPDDSYQFTGWSGDATGTNNPIQISMTGNKVITANFVPIDKPVFSFLVPAVLGR